MTTPADGDDYTYEPRPSGDSPMIPPQWVSISDFYRLVEEVQRLSLKVAALERRSDQNEGEM